MDYTLVQKEIQFALHNSKDPQQLFDLVYSLRPYDISEVMKGLSPEDQIDLISKLPIPTAAETLEYLEPEMQYHILRHLKDSVASPLLKQISSDAVVDMLLAIHPLQAQRLLDLLPEDYRDKINQLMTYPEYTAGSLMTVDYISARAHWNGEQALQHIRKVGHEAEIISYIYVTDIRGELVGICSLKEIILASPDTRLGDIATKDIISVPADMEQEEVANILSRYDFYALPVVDHQNRLIGIITVDDVVDVIQEEATEDFQKMGGSSPLSEPYFKTSIWELFRKRILWLLVLFIGGAYTANVLEKFSDTLSKIVELSFFIPLLTGTGGNTASQIVTTLVRALGMGEVKFQDLFRVIRKELLTGILLGLSLGMIMYLRAMMMGVNTNIGWVVSISILVIVLWSSLVSAVLPLLLHRLRVDPAVVSNPLITTLVDGTGLIIYFTTAKLLLHL
ncbi:magnesium transporter [Thermoflavimicrobium dichotomicum]|uniref:Magnesium transporter MgtE n=1 Tax=Thermoflavimicrobium dichotomicum TaxID=46223 RepID=A0A1I3LEQ2_9BACL|nr:magnesium transporter [Thermoflavimicrobium dichotomicum]SFI83259.1 magnesium transporter [Thermoflavimicrobium dichotomicum]